MEVHKSEPRFWRGAAASRSQLTNDTSTVGLRSTSPHISAHPSPASACSKPHRNSASAGPTCLLDKSRLNWSFAKVLYKIL